MEFQKGLDKIIIEDEGIVGKTNIDISPLVCVKIGAAIGSLGKNVSVGVGYNDTFAAKAFAYAMISGIQSVGATAWNFGSVFETQHSFCMAKSVAAYGIYIESGIITTIKLCGRSGISLSFAEEKKVEAIINNDKYKFMPHKAVGKSFNVESICNMYPFELIKLCDVSLEGISIAVRCGDIKIKRIMETTLTQLGAEIGDNIIINISPNGKIAAIYSHETGYIFHERILSLVCLSEFLKGKDIAADETCPAIVDKLADIHSQKVHRYSRLSSNSTQTAAKRKAVSQIFVRDALMLCVKFLSFIKAEKITLAQANELIPEFNVTNRYVAVSLSPQLLINKLKGETPEKIYSGIFFDTEKGSVSIKPVKSGQGVVICAESVNSETAQEICDFYEQKILDEMA